MLNSEDLINTEYYLVSTRCSGIGTFKLNHNESFQEVFKRLDLKNVMEIYKPGTWNYETQTILLDKFHN